MNYYNYDSRGLNSLQILSWLQSARRLCDPSPSSKCVSRVQCLQEATAVQPYQLFCITSACVTMCACRRYVKALQYLVDEHQ